MAKIFVSVPSLENPELRMITSLFYAINSCKEHDIYPYFTQNDSMISRVRNVHLSVFYNDFPDYDYFISLDSDLEIVNKFPSNNIFSKLVAHDKPFVGGLYALKKGGEPTCASVPMDRNRQPKFNNGLKLMQWLSTGCWCLKRSAVTKMIESYPELTYDGDDNMAGKKIYGLYLPMIDEIHNRQGKFKKLLSEDWSFAKRWRDLGGQIFADTSIVLNHYGKTAYKLWEVEAVATKRPTKTQPTKVPNTVKQNVKPKTDAHGLPIPGFDLGEIND